MFQRTTAIEKIGAMKKRIKVIPGGTSAGKTQGVLPILMNKAIKEPGLEISIVSATFPQLRLGAMKDFLKIMKETKRFRRHCWNKTEHTYRFPNGSYIEFFSADQEDKVRGPRRDILYINECNRISFDTYHAMLIRTHSHVYLDYNPSHEFWVHTKVIGDEDVEVLTLTFEDNEACPEMVKRELYKAIKKAKIEEERGEKNGFWMNWVNVYVYGKLGKLEGTAIKKWNMVPEWPEGAKKVGYGLDFGFTAPSALIKCGLYEGELYIQEEVYEKGLNIVVNPKNPEAESIEGRMIERDIPKLCNMVADSAEPRSIKQIRDAGYSCLPVKKKTDGTDVGITTINSFVINVVEGSPNVVHEFTVHRYKIDPRTGEYTSVLEKKNNHAIMAIVYYALRNLSSFAATRGKEEEKDEYEEAA